MSLRDGAPSNPDNPESIARQGVGTVESFSDCSPTLRNTGGGNASLMFYLEVLTCGIS